MHRICIAFGSLGSSCSTCSMLATLVVVLSGIQSFAITGILCPVHPVGLLRRHSVTLYNGQACVLPHCHPTFCIALCEASICRQNGNKFDF